MSEFFEQPVSRLVDSSVLENVQAIDACGELEQVDEKQRCVDVRMARLSEELWSASRQLEVVSQYVMLSDGSSHNPRELCRKNYKDYIEEASQKAEAGHYEKMISLLRNAVGFGRMGGVEENDIKKEFVQLIAADKIQPEPVETISDETSSEGLTDAGQSESETTTVSGSADPKRKELDTTTVSGSSDSPELKPVIVDEPEKGKRGFSEYFKEYSKYVSVGPVLSYEAGSQKSLAGMGLFLETLIPVKKGSPVVAGAEARAVSKREYADPNVFQGKFETAHWILMPPFFEVGYQSDPVTVLLSSGVWFTYAIVPESEENNTGYSNNLFENPNIRVGAKAYILDEHLSLGGGYLKTPDGSRYFAEVGVDLNFLR